MAHAPAAYFQPGPALRSFAGFGGGFAFREPMGARGHDDGVGGIRGHAFAQDFDQLVAGEIGEVVQGFDALFGQSDDLAGIEAFDLARRKIRGLSLSRLKL